MKHQTDTPVALTIAGSDSGGGAGIQTDLLSFAANGVFGTSAITCLTAQNPDGVSGIEVMPAEFVADQMAQVAGFFRLNAIKTGMLFNAPIIRAVAEFVAKNRDIPAVIDPVMVATSGAVLLQQDAIETLCAELIPLASLLTPNLDEAAVLGVQRPDSVEEMCEAARVLAKRFGVSVLMKGGHLENEEAVVDVLATPLGQLRRYTGEWIEDVDTHGSGCTLASAIAAGLARGKRMEQAIGNALEYLRRGMRHPLFLNGRAFIRH